MIWAKRLVLWPLAVLAGVVTLLLLAAWIGSSIPRNSDWTEPDAGIEIMVETNGVHTGIVMPLVTEYKDWREDFPATDLPASTRPYTHISASWGEREVFLNTPTWSDLSLPTAFGAATGGEGLLHIAHYVRPSPSGTVRVLRLRPKEYLRLVGEVEAQILPRRSRAIYPGYAEYDIFYDAPGRYHIGNSCNQWTADRLASAGVKIGRWTPIAGGVMKWIPKPDSLDNSSR